MNLKCKVEFQDGSTSFTKLHVTLLRFSSRMTKKKDRHNEEENGEVPLKNFTASIAVSNDLWK